MHRWAIVACVLGGMLCSAEAQDAATTAPSDTLLNGQVTFAPPAGWKLIGRRSDDRSIGYSRESPRAQLVITITPQTAAVPRALGPKLASQLKDVIHQEAKKGNIEIVTDPVVEPDERFLLKLHDRFRSHDTFGDRLQLFRGVGHNLVSVVVTSFSDDQAVAGQLFEVGEALALGIAVSGAKPAGANLDDVRITLDRPDGTQTTYATSQPVAFPQAKLRIAAPAGWTAEPTGNASGLIVTWRNPQDATDLITLTYRTIPESARDDPALRSIAVERLAAADKPLFEARDAKPVGHPGTVSDKRFIRKTSTDYQAGDIQFRVSFRQLRVGDGVVSVTSVALQDKAEQIDALADKVAAETRATLK